MRKKEVTLQKSNAFTQVKGTSEERFPRVKERLYDSGNSGLISRILTSRRPELEKRKGLKKFRQSQDFIF